MFQTNPNRQGNIEFVYIEELVPEDHLLRKMDETIDFSFIAEKTRPLCPAGYELAYRTTNRQGYREYKSNPSVCQDCPL